MNKKVTAKDIANICGVSQATVSYVINNRTNQKISEETRKKILDTVESLNYYPNASARNMRTRNCTSIGIVCAKDYSRQAFLSAAIGISRYFSRINYTITVYDEENTAGGTDCTPQYVQDYFSRMIDGLIYISNNNHQKFSLPASQNRIPYVILCMDGVFSDSSPVPHSFDHALTDCAKFCRERSFKSVGYFSIDNDGLFVNNKFPIFRKALSELYPECSLTHVICPLKERSFSGIQTFLQTYMQNHTFDLVISQNYDLGLALQREILSRDFCIPQKTKHIFLNHVNFYEMTYPSISGIYVPYEEMGEYAAQLILAVIRNEESSFEYREFPCRLIHRESTL